MRESFIIMPVKDSLQTTERAVRAIIASGHQLTVYDDNSTKENARRLEELAAELSFNMVHIADYTDHPSPNYLFVLQQAQQTAIATDKHLIIVESDVMVKPDTIELLCKEADKENIGLVAAVTEDEAAEINFPYLYLKGKKLDRVMSIGKRLSFCCTLLTNSFLNSYSFSELDPNKNWYDVQISHKSLELGYGNLLLTQNRVLHLPHSSRPWKKLKYTNPLKYYWQKLIYGRDKI